MSDTRLLKSLHSEFDVVHDAILNVVEEIEEIGRAGGGSSEPDFGRFMSMLYESLDLFEEATEGIEDVIEERMAARKRSIRRRMGRR